MPFQSEKQRRYLWANEPEIARDWTDTYGSRIRRDNGGIMQGGVQNFLGEQPMVNAPKYWQSDPDHEMTELAYITPRERDALVDMDMYGTMRGGPNKGPSGIMSLNGWGSSDPSQNRAGADISAAMDVSGSDPGWSAPGGFTSPGAKSPAELKILADRKGSSTVMPESFYGRTYQQPKSGWQKFNPLRLLGGFFGNVGRIGSGIMGIGKDWAGKMRGGINPKTGRYYTQQEYEDERSKRIGNKRIQNILGRDAPITEMTIQNLKGLGYTGEMPGIGSTGTSRAIDKDYTMQDTLREYPITTNRIQDIQKGWNNQGITGINQPLYDEMTDDVALSKLRAGTDTDVMKGSVLNKKPFDWSSLNPLNLIFGTPAEAKNYSLEDLKALGAKEGMIYGGNKQLDALEDYYQGAKQLISKPTQTLDFNTPAEVRSKVGSLGDIPFSGYESVNMDLIPQDFLSDKTDFTTQQSPYGLFGIK